MVMRLSHSNSSQNVSHGHVEGPNDGARMHMATLFEFESTLTDRYQTTVPESVRNALKLSKRDKIRYTIRLSGLGSGMDRAVGYGMGDELSKGPKVIVHTGRLQCGHVDRAVFNTDHNPRVAF